MISSIRQYQPWSSALWRFVRRNAWTGKFYQLDVQLGSACNARCSRCDSACCELSQPAEIDVSAVAMLAEEMRYNLRQARRSSEDPYKLQGYICGLGEPTEEKENLQKLKEIVEATKPFGFNWAFFTNGIYWDSELEAMLNNDHISVQVQCLGNDVECVAKEMGISEAAAEQQIANREAMYQSAVRRRVIDLMPGTNVCAAIVPEQANKEEVPEWVTEALSCNVFPQVAELEEAGLCVGDEYLRRRLAPVELSRIKDQIWERLHWNYQVPFCPATIGAIHINNLNQVTIDVETGFSCGWPGLKDAGSLVMGDIRKDSMNEISKRILEYRKSKIEDVRRLVYERPHMVFGGCGGNYRYLLQNYLCGYDEIVAATKINGY